MTAADIVIRDIDGHTEMVAVEELQKDVWGLPDLDVVPLTQLVAAKASGGVLIGAFDGDILVGFVYGFVGIEHERTTHHSHMLAVKPEYRNFNVGYRLKFAQRERVLTQGITEMTWTFDPLQSLNAYFNFSRLGVVSGRYLIDFYGPDAASFLHRHGTDRLWVTWPLMSRRVEERIDKKGSVVGSQKAEPLVEVDDDNAPICYEPEQALSGNPVLIEIPADINALERQDPGLAAGWRTATRTAFTEAFTAGYIAVEFVRDARAGRYILSCRSLNIRRG